VSIRGSIDGAAEDMSNIFCCEFHHRIRMFRGDDYLFLSEISLDRGDASLLETPPVSMRTCTHIAAASRRTLKAPAIAGMRYHRLVAADVSRPGKSTVVV
jgi:hypothetical protein